MKELLKNNLKIIIIVLITAIVTSFTSIFAYSLVAENVGFTPHDTTWHVENVEAALNNLNLRENQLSTHYSTDEQVVGEWIDGKPLYQKSYVINNKALSQGENNLINASSLNIESVILFSGTVGSSDKSRILQLPHRSKATFHNLSYNRNTKYIYFLSDGDYWTSADLKFSIQYTKTTD